MALSKTITILMQNQNNAAAPVAVNFTAQPMVQDGRLVPDTITANPGVKSDKFPTEGSAANPPMDSNS